jgi:hypothetical protein
MPIALQSQKSAGLALVDTDLHGALDVMDQAKVRVLACGRLKNGTDYLILADDAGMKAAIAVLDRLGVAVSGFTRWLKSVG